VLSTTSPGEWRKLCSEAEISQADCEARLGLRFNHSSLVRVSVKVNRKWAKVPFAPILSHIMYLSISFRKSTPPPNRRLNILISNSEHSVENRVWELTL